MAKADFEFYKLPGLGEFVVPAPASDPYNGRYNPALFGETAISHIVDVVTEKTQTEPAVTVVEATHEGLGCYFFQKFAAEKGRTLLGQQVSIEAQLPEEDGEWWSETMNEIDTALYGLGKRRQLEAPASEDEANNSPTILIESIDGFPLRLDDDKQPLNPNTRLRQLVLVDAFKWLPGPVRKSKTGQQLPPTFSPRPAKIAIAQTIHITGLNPALQAVA